MLNIKALFTDAGYQKRKCISFWWYNLYLKQYSWENFSVCRYRLWIFQYDKGTNVTYKWQKHGTVLRQFQTCNSFKKREAINKGLWICLWHRKTQKKNSISRILYTFTGISLLNRALCCHRVALPQDTFWYRKVKFRFLLSVMFQIQPLINKACCLSVTQLKVIAQFQESKLPKIINKHSSPSLFKKKYSMIFW